MTKKMNYIFTSKSQSYRGIMSTVCGIISIVSAVISVTMSFMARGEASERLGGVGLVSVLFSIVGLILGILSIRERDTFMMFPRLGLALSVLSIIAWTGIVYVGIRGIL